MFVEYSEKGHDELPPLTIIQGKGTILREESERNLIYDKSGLKNYKLVNQDDFILHLRSFEGGLEKANSRGIVSPAYHIFHGENADTRFYYPFFRSKYFISVLLKPHVYGIRDGKSIDVDGMKTIDIPYPTIEEQNKIGNYFARLDSLITLHQREYFLFDFSGESAKTAQNTLSWEQRKLSDLFEERNEQAPMDEEYPLMAFIANIGVAPKGDRYDRSALVHDEKGKKYKRTEKGDFIYSSNNLETGSIGLNNYGNACISPVYSIFKSKHTVDPEFMGRILLRKEFINQMVSFRQGVVYGQWKIHEDDFLNLDILVPQTTEQQKIGGFFSELDKIITLHQREYFSFDFGGGSAKNVQKTLSWEQRKFSDFTFPAGERNKDDLDLEPFAITNNQGFIAQSEAHDDFGYMKDVDRKMYIVVKPNSFAYNPARINVGSLGYYEGAENVIVSSLYEVFQTAEYVDDKFLKHWFKTKAFQDWIERLQEGSVRLYFYYDKLCECIMSMPSVEEQRKIGAYLDKIDNLITLHQHKPNKKGHDVLTVMPFKGNQRKPHYLCS